jgi:hypothetical protein
MFYEINIAENAVEDNGSRHLMFNYLLRNPLVHLYYFSDLSNTTSHFVFCKLPLSKGPGNGPFPPQAFEFFSNTNKRPESSPAGRPPIFGQTKAKSIPPTIVQVPRHHLLLPLSAFRIALQHCSAAILNVCRSFMAHCLKKEAG